MDETTNGSPTHSTGINGLDFILRGGLVPNRLYLVEGVPGAGKTTLALQFLREGAKNGEPVLYVGSPKPKTSYARWLRLTAGTSKACGSVKSSHRKAIFSPTKPIRSFTLPRWN